jgi:hypothetical protein
MPIIYVCDEPGCQRAVPMVTKVAEGPQDLYDVNPVATFDPPVHRVMRGPGAPITEPDQWLMWISQEPGEVVRALCPEHTPATSMTVYNPPEEKTPDVTES